MHSKNLRSIIFFFNFLIFMSSQFQVKEDLKITIYGNRTLIWIEKEIEFKHNVGFFLNIVLDNFLVNILACWPTVGTYCNLNSLFKIYLYIKWCFT